MAPAQGLGHRIGQQELSVLQCRLCTFEATSRRSTTVPLQTFAPDWEALLSTQLCCSTQGSGSSAAATFRTVLQLRVEEKGCGSCSAVSSACHPGDIGQGQDTDFLSFFSPSVKV